MTTISSAVGSALRAFEADSLFAGLIPPIPAAPITEEQVTPSLASDRDRLIDEIERASPGISRDWLEGFQAPALEEYLAHLRAAAKPRGRGAVWVRPSIARAITTSVAPE